MSGRLTHLDEQGRARMVDVSAKPRTDRSARARATVRMSPAVAAAVRDGSGPKGEVLTVARLAGIQAAKQTGLLIPLAHPLALTFVDVAASVDADAGVVELIGEARTSAETGVEMEAMTAVSVAALTVYDMVKGLERGIEIEQIVLLEKQGGRSDYRREQAGLAQDTHERAAPGHPPAPPIPQTAAPPPRRAVRGGAALLTISTSRAAGAGGEDESRPAMALLVTELGIEVRSAETIPDERELIESRLLTLSEDPDCVLILTSGGTGVSPTDVTPEATRAVIEREIPGLAEAMRMASLPHTGNWMLSRMVAGVRGETLIVNLPGSPAAIEQIGEEIAAPLLHALELIAGGRAGHGAGA